MVKILNERIERAPEKFANFRISQKENLKTSGIFIYLFESWGKVMDF